MVKWNPSQDPKRIPFTKKYYYQEKNIILRILIYLFYYFLFINNYLALLGGATEYTDCIAAEG